MASKVPIKDKDGNIRSYQIQVYRGRDENGKKLRPYTMCWEVPTTYRSEKAIQKALDKVASDFETACKRGEVVAIKKNFKELAEYYIELSQRDDSEKSVEFYRSLLPRINAEFGHVALPDLTAAHLNHFYLKLQTEDVRLDKKAMAKENMVKLKNKKKLTHAKLAELSGLSHNTIRLACQGKNISPESADKISAALGKKTTDLFTFRTPDGSVSLSAKSINHYHTFIHSVLQLGLKEGLVTRNVAELASPPKVKRSEAEFFEVEEIMQIRDALQSQPAKYRMMIFLLVDTGIRKGELFGIRIDSIDFDEGTILIDNNIQWVRGKGLIAKIPKGNDIRTVSVSPEVLAELKKYILDLKKFKFSLGDPNFNSKGYLFVQQNGQVMHPSSLNGWLRRFETKYNLPHIYPHKFRHSQASILYSCNIDTVTISKRLGHKQVSTTQNIYAHAMKRSDKKASDAIANVLYRRTL